MRFRLFEKKTGLVQSSAWLSPVARRRSQQVPSVPSGAPSRYPTILAQSGCHAIGAALLLTASHGFTVSDAAAPLRASIMCGGTVMGRKLWKTFRHSKCRMWQWQIVIWLALVLLSLAHLLEVKGNRAIP